MYASNASTSLRSLAVARACADAIARHRRECAVVAEVVRRRERAAARAVRRAARRRGRAVAREHEEEE